MPKNQTQHRPTMHHDAGVYVCCLCKCVCVCVGAKEIKEMKMLHKFLEQSDACKQRKGSEKGSAARATEEAERNRCRSEALRLLLMCRREGVLAI